MSSIALEGAWQLTIPLPTDLQPSQKSPNRNVGDADPSANRKMRQHWSSVAHPQP